MGKTNRCDIGEDEALAEEVRQYPCLYDKADKGYKDRDRRKNAWIAIETALGREEAEKKFDVLKKRFSRKRNNLKKISASGSGLHDIAIQQKELEEYTFLNWLTPFIRQRSTKSNFPIEESNIPDDTSAEYGAGDSGEVDEDTQNVDLVDSESESTASTNMDATNASGRIERKRATETPIATQRAIKLSQRDLLSTEFEVMQNVSKILTKKLEKPAAQNADVDVDDIFGKMIASELKQFPEHIKFHVKHELNMVIYKYRMQNMSAHINPTQQFLPLAFSSPNSTYSPSSIASQVQQATETLSSVPPSGWGKS